MRRIKKNVVTSQTLGEDTYEAYNSQADTCAILISYTGENNFILQLARILRKQNIPVIALTSIGEIHSPLTASGSSNNDTGAALFKNCELYD